MDVIEEEQVKLGYRSETIRLYYPLRSLNRFLKAEYTAEQMRLALKAFCEETQERLGNIEITNRGDRFCLAVPPEGTDYVHEHMGDTAFIRDFVNTVARHGVSMDEVLRQFYRYSDHVHVEKAANGEFDYLVYFEDGKPDDFRYCITDEGGHIIYHRFTPEDYREDFL